MHTRSLPAKAGNDGYAGTLGTSKKKKMTKLIKIREGEIKIKEKAFQIQFGLITVDEGIYNLEIFYNEDFEIAKFFSKDNSQNFINRRFDLEGKDEEFNLIQLTDLFITQVRYTPNNIAKFTSYGFFRVTQSNSAFVKEEKEIENEIFHIELEGFEMLFTEITEKPRYRGGQKIEDFNDFERDHSSSTISIKEKESPWSKTYLFRFHKPSESNNTFITIESITKPRTKLLEQEYNEIKNDFVNYLSFINGGFVKVRKEFSGTFRTLNKIESEITTIYSFKSFRNQIRSDYIPIRDGFSMGDHILHHCLKCFQRFRELNSSLDLTSILIMLNGTNEAPTIEQKFFTLIVAIERLAFKHIETIGRQDIELIPSLDYSPIKEELLKTVSKFKKQIGNDDKLRAFKGRIGELHLIKKNDTKNKFIKLLEAASIPKNEEIDEILFIVRHSSVHKGEIGTGEKRITNFLELDKLLRDIILNLIEYKGKRKRKHWK